MLRFQFHTSGVAWFHAILRKYTSLVHTVPGKDEFGLNSGTDLLQCWGGWRLLSGVAQPPVWPVRVPS